MHLYFIRTVKAKRKKSRMRPYNLLNQASRLSAHTNQPTERSPQALNYMYVRPLVQLNR